MKTLHLGIIIILVAGSMTVSQHAIAQSENPPVIITQVELGSPLRTLPNNQTCTFPPDPKLTTNCLVGLVPGHKVPCSYFLGSATCEPLHQWSSGTNHTCLEEYMTSSAPQWFDIYNTQDQTVDLQNFTAYDKLNYGPYGQDGPSSAILELKPHEGCTFPWLPIDEALTMGLNNMSMAVSYDYNGQHYNVTTPSFSDTQNDTRTWQYDGNKWSFAPQGTISTPQFFAGGTNAIPYSILRSAVPTLTPSENQSLVNVALSIPGLQNWSHDWHFIDMGFLGNNKLATSGFEWQYAIIDLKAPSSSAPIPCYNDWWAWVDVDMTTMKVVRATYPTMDSHNCQVATGGGPGTSSIIASVIEPPLKQFKSGTAIEDIVCGKTGQYLFLKAENRDPICVTLGTEDKLSRRGFIETNQTAINQIVLKKAREFILSSPTFNRFGVQSTLSFDLKSCDLTVPQSCYPHAYFQINGTGNYGNGTGSIQMTSTKTSYHVMTLTIFDMNQVQCAVVDGIWDEKNQKPLDRNDPLCGMWYGYKDGTG